MSGKLIFDEQDRCRKDVFKAWLVQGAEFSGAYGFPRLKACDAIPTKAVPFHNALKTTVKNQWVHFYVDDHRFECLWNNPTAYLKLLKKFDGVISPDFSIYTDMPLAMQIWNTYRNRALAFWLQSKGIHVIPNVQWGDERSYSFCFDGIPKRSTIAISTNGCIQNKHDRFYFKKGLSKMLEIVEPITILNYSYMPDDVFQSFYCAGT